MVFLPCKIPIGDRIWCLEKEHALATEVDAGLFGLAFSPGSQNNESKWVLGLKISLGEQMLDRFCKVAVAFKLVPMQMQ